MYKVLISKYVKKVKISRILSDFEKTLFWTVHHAKMSKSECRKENKKIIMEIIRSCNFNFHS